MPPVIRAIPKANGQLCAGKTNCSIRRGSDLGNGNSVVYKGFIIFSERLFVFEVMRMWVCKLKANIDSDESQKIQLNPKTVTRGSIVQMS